MIAKVKLLTNFKEMQEFHAAVQEHGMEEAFNLGFYTKPPTEKFVSKEFLFKMNDVETAWVVGDNNELINIKMNDAEIWSLEYNKNLWGILIYFL